MENEEFQDKLNNSMNDYLANNKKSVKIFMIFVKNCWYHFIDIYGLLDIGGSAIWVGRRLMIIGVFAWLNLIEHSNLSSLNSHFSIVR